MARPRVYCVHPCSQITTREPILGIRSAMLAFDITQQKVAEVHLRCPHTSVNDRSHQCPMMYCKSLRLSRRLSNMVEGGRMAVAGGRLVRINGWRSCQGLFPVPCGCLGIPFNITLSTSGHGLERWQRCSPNASTHCPSM